MTRSSSTKTILSNAGSLLGSIAVTSLLGFPYWWIAARAFPAAAVGYAAATISAMTLVGTVGMLGLGTFLTGELPRQGRDRESLFATALTIATCGGFLLGLVFAVVAPGLLGLHALAGRIGPILLFATGVALTSTTMVLDQALIGLLRGGLQLRRNILFAISKLVILAAVGITSLSTRGPVIYATWIVGLALSLIWLVLAATRRGTRVHRCRPRWGLFREWRRPAMEHHFLNLALQAPGLTLPLVVAAAVSVTASAYYYTASLISGVLSYGAIALTFALYAVSVHDVASLAPTLRFTLRLAFGVILLANLVLLVGARLILRFFGPEYASHAVTALRLLGAYNLLLIVKDHYVAIARIRGRLLKAATLTTAGAVVELSLASVGGAYGGLTWLVLGALVGLALEAMVMSRTVISELKPIHRQHPPSAHSELPVPELSR